MPVDIACLENVTLATLPDDVSIIRYTCNIAFPNTVNPVKNIKFPGTMVAALTRTDVNKLAGGPQIHVPYKPMELVAWMNPLSRNIPPLKLAGKNRSFESKVSPRVKKTDIITDLLDFGPVETGIIDFPVFMPYNPLSIDFDLSSLWNKDHFIFFH